MLGTGGGQLDGGSRGGRGDVADLGAGAFQVALQLGLEALRQGPDGFFGRRLAAGGQGERAEGGRAGGEGLAAVEAREG